MAASEIDDIFAGKVPKESTTAKGKAKAPNGPPASSSASSSKKKKSKKRKRQEDHVKRPAPTVVGPNEKKGDPGASEGNKDNDRSEKKRKPKRQRVVETVQDPSVAHAASITSSSSKEPKDKSDKKTSKSLKDKKKDNDLGRFKDSRGTNPRKRTDDGYLVYKEDELGINNSAGDTPLCPFDCNCCF